MNLDNMNMFPLEFGASERTYYGDGFYHPAAASGLRGLVALGNANNGGYAGVGCLNGNNAPSNARTNIGAFLNSILNKGVSLSHWRNISQDDGETRSLKASVIPVGLILQTNRPIIGNRHFHKSRIDPFF